MIPPAAMGSAQQEQEARIMDTSSRKTDETAVPAPGTGLCAEAQADGVPCSALGKECEICEKAYPLPDHVQEPGEE
jgi:hypothetical protein